MIEIWKEYKHTGYMVSNMGRVKSPSRDILCKNNQIKHVESKILQGNPCARNRSDIGYLCIGIHTNGVIHTKMIHRLVAELFLPNPNNYEQVNHIDNNKHNNRVDNLEWCTPKYNCKQRELANPNYHLKHTKKVRCIETGEIFTSLRTPAKIYGVSKSTIQRACTGKSRSGAGLHWEYI